MWNIQTPAQAKAKIAEQIADLGIQSQRTWKNRLYLWSERMSTKS